MRENGMAMALKNTFLAPMGKLMQKVGAVRSAVPFNLGNFIAPFLNVNVNLLKTGFEWTPFNFLRVAKMAVKGELGGDILSRELGKAAIGSGVMLATIMEAAKGNITGTGPTDPGERATLRRTGWQPQSIKQADGKYLSYANMPAPISMALGIASDFSELMRKSGATEDEKNYISKKMIQSGIANIENHSWVKGMADVMTAINDPSKLNQFLGNKAASFIPGAALTGMVTDYTDPYLRDARTILDKVKSRIPGLSQQVMPVRDMYGQAVKKADQVAGFMAQSPSTGTPIDAELARLGAKTPVIPRAIQGIDLTPEQHDVLQQLSGIYMKNIFDKPNVSAMMLGNTFPDAAKKALAEQLMTDAVKAGHSAFIVEAAKNKQLFINPKRFALLQDAVKKETGK
jgi:hypothetical protein